MKTAPALSHAELDRERAAYLAREWPKLREVRARSLLVEFDSAGRDGRPKGREVDADSLAEDARHRWREEPEGRLAEIVQRALELHAGGTVRARVRTARPRSQRNTRGGKR